MSESLSLTASTTAAARRAASKEEKAVEKTDDSLGEFHKTVESAFHKYANLVQRHATQRYLDLAQFGIFNKDTTKMKEGQLAEYNAKLAEYKAREAADQATANAALDASKWALQKYYEDPEKAFRPLVPFNSPHDSPDNPLHTYYNDLYAISMAKADPSFDDTDAPLSEVAVKWAIYYNRILLEFVKYLRSFYTAIIERRKKEKEGDGMISSQDMETVVYHRFVSPTKMLVNHIFNNELEADRGAAQVIVAATSRLKLMKEKYFPDTQTGALWMDKFKEEYKGSASTEVKDATLKAMLKILDKARKEDLSGAPMAPPSLLQVAVQSSVPDSESRREIQDHLLTDFLHLKTLTSHLGRNQRRGRAKLSLGERQRLLIQSKAALVKFQERIKELEEEMNDRKLNEKEKKEEEAEEKKAEEQQKELLSETESEHESDLDDDEEVQIVEGKVKVTVGIKRVKEEPADEEEETEKKQRVRAAVDFNKEGCECVYCHKKIAVAGDAFTCTHCEKPDYCSMKCAKLHWTKGGHSKQCTKTTHQESSA